MEPGMLSNKIDSTIQATQWNEYERLFIEVKKHVDSKISALGFEEIVFIKDSIVASESDTIVKVSFNAQNRQDYEANLNLKQESGADFNVSELSDKLVEEAKVIRLGAMVKVISLAASIMNKKIVLRNAEENDFRLEIQNHTEDEVLVTGIEYPKSNVVRWPPQEIADEIVKSFQEGLKCEENC